MVAQSHFIVNTYKCNKMYKSFEYETLSTVIDSLTTYYCPIVMACELQIWMSILAALILVMLMQLATTLKGVTLALVILDTQAMDFLAQVCKCIYFDIISGIAKGEPG